MFGEQQGIQNVKTTIIKRALQTLLLSATLSLSAAHAAEQRITIKGEVLFASLPQLGDYQGPLAEPLRTLAIQAAAHFGRSFPAAKSVSLTARSVSVLIFFRAV